MQQPGRRKSHQSHAWRTLFRKQFQKSKMCHYYTLGQCRYGSECPFAHDESELTVPPDLTKTTMCKAWAAGQCQLPSEQCQYAHGEEELRVTPAFEVSSLCKRRTSQETPQQEAPQQGGGVDQVRAAHPSAGGTTEQVQGMAAFLKASNLHGPQAGLNLQAEASSRHEACGTADTHDPSASRVRLGTTSLQTRRTMNNLTLPISRALSNLPPEGNVTLASQQQEPVPDSANSPSDDRRRNRAAKKRASKGDQQSAVVNLASLIPHDSTRQSPTSLTPAGFTPVSSFCQNFGLDMRAPFQAWPHAVMPGAAPPMVVAGPHGPWIPTVSNMPMTQMFGSQNSPVSTAMPGMHPGACVKSKGKEIACQTEPCESEDMDSSPAATTAPPNSETTPISGRASTSHGGRMDWAFTPSSSRIDWARTPSGACSPVSPKRWARRPASPRSPVSPKRWARYPPSEACPDSPKLRWARTPSSGESPERGGYGWTRTPSSHGSRPRSPQGPRCEPAYVEPGGVVTFGDLPDDEAYDEEPMSPVMKWARTPSMSPPRRINGNLRLTNRGPPEITEIRHRLADIFPAARTQMGAASSGGGPWGGLLPQQQQGPPPFGNGAPHH